jgi:hypothetical protein
MRTRWSGCPVAIKLLLTLLLLLLLLLLSLLLLLLPHTSKHVTAFAQPTVCVQSCARAQRFIEKTLMSVHNAHKNFQPVAQAQPSKRYCRDNKLSPHTRSVA